MMPVFVDTSFFLALVFKDDMLWSRAHAWYKSSHGPFMTTEFVLLEIGNGLAKTHLRGTAQKIIDFAREEDLMTVIPAESHWFKLGYRLFQDRQDKDWSLTDCISFQVMHEFGITDALTHDHHFQQAGFRPLLREDPPSN